MKHIKSWEYGDLTRKDQFNNTTEYNSVELVDDRDDIIPYDLSRPLRNIYDTIGNVNFIIDKLSSTLGFNRGIYLNDFEIDPATDIKTVVVKNSSNNIVRKHFLRISPGVIYLGNKNIPIYPTTSIAERQLHKILKLENNDSIDEGVKINYYDNTDKFDIQIRKMNSSGILQNYNFSKGDYGDSFSGYDTGIEALLSVYGDSVNFSEFKDTINENIENIYLEDNVILNNGDSVYIGFDDDCNLVKSEDEINFPLYRIRASVISNRIRINELNDIRTSIGDTIKESELIYNGTLSNGQYPTLSEIGGTTIIGNGVLSLGTETFSDYNGDSLSGRFISTNTSRLYFSNSISSTNLNNLLPGNTYRFSVRIKLNNNTSHNNVSISLHEFLDSSTEITTVRARDISGWQELVLSKEININSIGVNISLDIQNSGNVSFDNVSFKNVLANSFVTTTGEISNISGDTLSINVIQGDGDSKITFSNYITGDTFIFNNIIINERFINQFIGDRIEVNTIETDYLKNNIRLNGKITGDTIELNTLVLENLLGNILNTPANIRRDVVESKSNTNYTIIDSDEGKILNFFSNNNITVNLPVLNNFYNGFLVNIRKSRENNTLTLNPGSFNNINGENTYILTENGEIATVVWNGNNWIVPSYYLPSPRPISKGGSGQTSSEDLLSFLGVLSTTQGDSKYSEKNHTHSQYLTSVPSEYLTQSEGDGRYYRKSQVDSRVSTSKSNLRNGVSSNLNTLRELASAINNDDDIEGTLTSAINSGYNRSSANNRYRQDIIYSGDTVVSYNGDTRSINVSSFDENEYRWLEVTYSELNTQYRLEDEGPFLYTINDTNNSLYTINPTLGTASRVHASNTFGSGGWSSLASHNGTLYASNSSNDALYTINTTLGTATRVHASNTLGSGNWYSLTSHNGTLYVINDSNDALYTINPTLGTASRVHASNTLGSGTWSSLTSHNGTLYAINNSNRALYTINITLGTATRVHATNILGSGSWYSLAFHNGTLYAISDNNDALYTINSTLGTASRVHASNTLGSGNWGSLASHAIPKDSINIDDFDGIVRPVFSEKIDTDNLIQSFPITLGDDVVYTIDTSGSHYALYTINPTLGTSTRVHASNELGSGTWSSLTSHNGTLYTINDSDRALYTINSTLGTATRVHASNTLGSGNWLSLASHNGTLYTINFTNKALYTINTTLGTSTRVYASNELGSGNWRSLASHNGTLYTINNDNDALYTINSTLETASRVHASNILGSGNWYSLTSHNGTLYTINNTNDDLYTINTTNGTATRVHASNTLVSGSWRSLASGYSQINTPNQGFYTPNADRLTTWRRSSDSNTRLRFNLVNGTSDIHVHEIVGIP